MFQVDYTINPLYFQQNINHKTITLYYKLSNHHSNHHDHTIHQDCQSSLYRKRILHKLLHLKRITKATKTTIIKECCYPLEFLLKKWKLDRKFVCNQCRLVLKEEFRVNLCRLLLRTFIGDQKEGFSIPRGIIKKFSNFMKFVINSIATKANCSNKTNFEAII